MLSFLLIAAIASHVTAQYSSDTTDPLALDSSNGVKYRGLNRNGIEIFLNVKYGQDTGGTNRFRPPRPFVPIANTTYDATTPGPACPQPLGQWNSPLTLNDITKTSEDCLNLNIARPMGLNTNSALPVMVWIHGGSFWVGSNMEPTHQPDGLILESLAGQHPVIHVALNYRLGFFGFAQSKALRDEGSMNAGLRDQRLAIEWVRDHIKYFGGDGERITIFGQSSGGLSVGLQLLAYGGTKPLPYQQGICQSQALEPGITGNYTFSAMEQVVFNEMVNCSSNDSFDAPETIECLRRHDTQTLFEASFSTYVGDGNHNLGDIWLPGVDGDFIPDAPSTLVKAGRFGQATYMMGWTQDDVNFFTNFSIATQDDTYTFLKGYIPHVPDNPAGSAVYRELANLYPVEDFEHYTSPSTNLTAEFFRSARILRDILMVCEPLFLGEHMHRKGNRIFYYNWNQTILEPIIAKLYNISDIGVVHTSEFAYMYGNLSHWNVSGYPWHPTQADDDLRMRSSRSWSAFATYGEPSPSCPSGRMLHGFNPGYDKYNQTRIFTIGGPGEGLSYLDGPNAFHEIAAQKLRERCSFINSDRLIQYLQF